MNKAVFLDRDGTINIEKHYLYTIDEFEFLPGVTEGLRLLQEKGYKLIVVTNQSGIARGYYSEEDFSHLNEWMVSKLHQYGVFIDAVYFCPHLQDALIEKYRMKCDCRKPKIGLFLKAAEEFNISFAASWSIGDRLRDCSICETTACKGALVGNTECSSVIEMVKNNQIPNVFYASDLYHAAIRIAGESGR